MQSKTHTSGSTVSKVTDNTSSDKIVKGYGSQLHVSCDSSLHFSDDITFTYTDKQLLRIATQVPTKYTSS